MSMTSSVAPKPLVPTASPKAAEPEERTLGDSLKVGAWTAGIPAGVGIAGGVALGVAMKMPARAMAFRSISAIGASAPLFAVGAGVDMLAHRKFEETGEANGLFRDMGTAALIGAGLAPFVRTTAFSPLKLSLGQHMAQSAIRAGMVGGAVHLLAGPEG